MPSVTLAAAGIVALVLLCFVGANALHDRGVPRPVIRALAAMVGGLAFLIAVLTLDARVATALASLVAAGVLVARVWFRGALRGVRGGQPSQAWAEVTYPLAGACSLLIGWVVLGDRWLGFTPIAFMAWGDAVAGLARAEVTRISRFAPPSMVMLVATACVAALFQPGWGGLAGSLVATASEGRTPRVLTVRDDNMVVVLSSLTAMVLWRSAFA